MKGLLGSVLRWTGITSSPKLLSDEEILALIYEEGAKKKRPQLKRGDPWFCGPYMYGHKPPEFIETQCDKCGIVTRHQRHYKGGFEDYNGHCSWYYYQCNVCNTRWFYVEDAVTEIDDYELTRDHGEHTDNPSTVPELE